jgi:cytochrome c oxidase subunit 2
MATRVRLRAPVTVLLVVAALALAGSAAAGNGGIAPVSPDSPNASRIADSYWFVMAFTGAIFVLVEGLLIAFAVRFRRGRRRRDAEGPQIRGHTRLELIWTALPVVILAAIAGFVFYKLPGIEDVPPASAAGDRVHVTVEGEQFYWQFRYPNGAISIDTLRVPVGKVVTLDVDAPAWDVIHSWWVPALGGKIDAIPGHPNHTWFKASRVATYVARCAEFCGVQHAVMHATVEVVPEAEYNAWVRRQRAGANLGQEEWQGVCQKCHELGGKRLIGPNLAGNTLLADARGLETLLRNGRNEMPAVGKDWTDQQMKALTDYVQRFAQAGGQSGGG